MKYLIIKNKGTVPLHMVTHLGISTARDVESKIGQFGSGLKHGILTALRANHDLEIYSGNTRIIPKFEPMQHDSSIEELVFYIDGERKTTSMTRGFGDLDWSSDMDLALREFISNAIDQGETAQGCWFLADALVTSPDTTLIVIPYTGMVQSFISNIGEWYVNKPLNAPFSPHTSQTGLCYLKGVKVGKIDIHDCPCLLNYNLREAKLNESRTIDSDALRTHASGLLNKDIEHLKTIFRNITGAYFETQAFSPYSMVYYTDESSAIIRNAWQAVHGDAVPVSKLDQKFFISKNIPHIVVPLKWYDILSSSHVKLGYDKKKQAVEEKYTLSSPTADMQAMLDRGWEIISSVRLTNQKNKPACGSFTEIMSEGSQTLGMYFKGTVWFNADEPVSLQTCLEELTHHITGANDETRDFQDFALRLAARLATKLEQTKS